MKRLILLAAGGFVLSFVVVFAALAHDRYTPLKNARGEPCCGGDDCEPYDGPVAQVKGGWMVENTFVPSDRAMPSFDARFHRCIWGGEVRCLLVPMTM